MKSLIGAAVVVFALAAPAAINPAAAATPQVKHQSAGKSHATDLSARRRHHRRHFRHYRRYGYRPYYRPYYGPRYYARPYYYRPYAYYRPAPFPFGLGFGPFWW